MCVLKEEQENSRFQLSSLLGFPSHHILTITIANDSHSGREGVPCQFHAVLSRLVKNVRFCHAAFSHGVLSAENLNGKKGVWTYLFLFLLGLKPIKINGKVSLTSNSRKSTCILKAMGPYENLILKISMTVLTIFVHLLNYLRWSNVLHLTDDYSDVSCMCRKNSKGH